MTKKPAIFLSAGIPDRNVEVWKPDVLAIREAVLALVSVVMAESKFDLVFGGHPAISPLVEHAARTLKAAHRVFIFQADFFEAIIPPEAKAFENFEFIKMSREQRKRVEQLRQELKRDSLSDTQKKELQEALAEERNDCLEKMRTKMVQSRSFVAGVFIGGMEGVEEEWKIFRTKCPDAMVLPIASTGGAARKLWDDDAGSFDPETRRLTEDSKRYRGLFRKVLIPYA